MRPRLSALALFTIATLAGSSAHAGGFSPNLSIRVTAAADGAIMTGRHPIMGYGPSYVPPPTYGGPGREHRGTTKFDPDTQFIGLTDNTSAGTTTLKPPKLPK